MKRINTKIENCSISKLTSKLFNVKSSGQLYQVWFGSETQLPTCQCIDFRIKKLPCKHICAVVQQPGVGWESLGSRFGTHPLFSLDNEVVRSSPQSDKCKPPSEPSNSTCSPPVNCTSVEQGKSKPFIAPSPAGKKLISGSNAFKK